ncbi:MULTISPECIES: alpha/beta hydrolase [unclassified Pseudomonas]|uniref:alpha/beta fold hydrolase n=1 Tax=unclassified Pseudomonas TaxID=196821 RepID=UPI0024588706|nr:MULTISPECIES: alpha/beta hydrolase [unclassified Pseudomonas]MDH4560772.1 alpha/beta hydrolase [Pseudomonas sp. BN411]MDH4653724.1 alpha/beta hydrolase [Pseudomonas sp. BN606]MDH4874121.1 alpha/beta hydrolase [Pseudomonas sp. BN515]
MRKMLFKGAAGISLAADVGGDPDRQPIVLLHGGGQTRHSWKNTAQRMVDRGFHTVSLDLRGHGDSGWSHDQDYSLDVFVADLHEVMETLRRPPVLVGASLGGLTSLLAIGEARQPAHGLVLVDVVPRIEAEGAAEILRFMQAAPNGFTSLQEAADAVAAYLPHRQRPTDFGGLQRNLRLGADGRYRWHYDPAFTAPNNQRSRRPERLEAAASRVDIPTLLIRGGASRLVSKKGVNQLLALIPHARLANVAGAEHMVAGDSNDAFNDALFDFLNSSVEA